MHVFIYLGLYKHLNMHNNFRISSSGNNFILPARKRFRREKGLNRAEILSNFIRGIKLAIAEYSEMLCSAYSVGKRSEDRHVTNQLKHNEVEQTFL